MDVSLWLNYSSDCDCSPVLERQILLPVLQLESVIATAGAGSASSRLCAFFFSYFPLLSCSDLVTADLTASFHALQSAATASMPNEVMPSVLRSRLQTSL